MEKEMTKYEKRLNEKCRQTIDFTRWLSWKGSGKFVTKYIGADIGFVREWISKMFVGDMSWENYGSLWVIDHVVPFRAFDLFDENDLAIVWNYRNLMPILSEDNLKKQGNVFFCFELLLPYKDKDFIYRKLYERIEPEVEWMMKYVHNYDSKPLFI
jgi:hypothetical protein